jgi:hypothetical protein
MNTNNFLTEAQAFTAYSSILLKDMVAANGADFVLSEDDFTYFQGDTHEECVKAMLLDLGCGFASEEELEEKIASIAAVGAFTKVPGGAFFPIFW